MNIMTKRGNHDNVVTYEHFCDTKADMAQIPNNQITLGSTVIVLKDTNTDLGIYMATSDKEWVPLLNMSGGSGLPSQLELLHVLSSNEYDNSTHMPTVQNPESNVLYLVPSADPSANDLFDEWIYTGTAWEKFGGVAVNGASVQADWNQNDVNAADYIKNRICYTEDGAEEIIFDGVGYGGGSSIFVGADIVESLSIEKFDTTSTFNILYDGVSRYSGTLNYLEGQWGPNIVGYLANDMQNPIFFVLYDTLNEVITQVGMYSPDASYTPNKPFIIKKGNPALIHKIDRKYLPDNLGSNANWTQENNTSSEYIRNRPNLRAGSDSSSSSIIEGDIRLNIASGNYAHAEGGHTTASGHNSHAEGIVTEASGFAAHAEGQGSVAAGLRSHAEGNNCLAGADASHAEGEATTVLGINGHSEGTNTLAGKYAHSEGEGYVSYIYGINSVPDTTNTYTSNASDLQFGTAIISDSTCTYVVESEGTTFKTASPLGTITKSYIKNHTGGCAIGEVSHSEGYYTRAVGDHSHAEGTGALAFGHSSHAGGSYTKALGENCFAQGNNTLANGCAMTALGAYNDYNKPDLTINEWQPNHAYSMYDRVRVNQQIYWSKRAHTSGEVFYGDITYWTQDSLPTDYLLAVGNGTSENTRRNAFSVQVNGNATVQTSLTIGNTTINEAQLQALLALLT